MSYWAIISCVMLGMGIVWLVVPLVLKSALLTNLSQRRRELHHTHQKPIPRLGGLALVGAFVGIEAFIALFYPEHRASHAIKIQIMPETGFQSGADSWLVRINFPWVEINDCLMSL